MRDPIEVRLERREQQDIRRYIASEREIAAERGGTDIAAHWFAGKVRATEQQPGWMPRELGFTVMEARICPTSSTEKM